MIMIRQRPAWYQKYLDDIVYSNTEICMNKVCTSGVGVQSRILIEGLLKTGKYKFLCLGGALKHQNYDVVQVNPDFVIKPVDGFGTKDQIRQLLTTERPDAMVLITDPRQFVWLWEMEDEIHQVCPIAYWHVWDNDPYPKFNEIWYESTDLINCISWKTYELVKPHFPERTNYIPHAFPKDVYKPFPKEMIKKIREQHFGNRSTWQIGLWVNRNATRKMPNDVLECFKEHLDNLEREKGHRNSLLIMHTDPTDVEGPNLMAVSEMLELTNNVWFSTQKLDFPDMNVLHNITDYTINISKAEGYGLTTHVNLQIGKPIIALKTGGMIRQVVDWRDGSENGIAIEPAVRMLVGSQAVPYIYDDHADKKAVTAAFMKLYNMTEEEKDALAKKTIAYVDFEMNYDNVIKKWDETLEKCIIDFKDGKWNKWSMEELTLKEKEQALPPKIDNKQPVSNNALPAQIQMNVTKEKLNLSDVKNGNNTAQKVTLPNVNSNTEVAKKKMDLNDLISVRSNKPKVK